MKQLSTINGYIKQAIVENWDTEALTNLHAQTYLYRDVARKIAKMHIMFRAAGLQEGDKIALCGKNSAEWTIAFLAALTYGAVAVPLLNEFTPETIAHLVNHCDAKVFFADKVIWQNVEQDKLTSLKAAVAIDDFSLLHSADEEIVFARKNLNSLFGNLYPERFRREDFSVAEVAGDAMVLINYTAGSTGFSKGVMISEHALWSNIQFCIDGLTFLKPGDTMLSLLPLAHMYGLVIEMLHPLVKGCHVYLLGRTPSPKILLDGFSTVRPKLIVAVPLVIEKIIRTRIFPKLKKPAMRCLLKIPGVNSSIYKKIRASLIKAFGGELIEMIVGGAPLAKDVEEFLKRIKFPITVGYGMTECAPLISYAPHTVSRSASCGRPVHRMEIRIDSTDPYSRPGLLWVKGDNVMLGYYKNDEASRNVLRNGWMNTGDICQIDKDGFIYIRGRDKNMILGPSGQNIYPEEIEAVINKDPLVLESIVIENNGRLEVLVFPDYDLAKSMSLDDASKVLKALESVVKEANRNLPSYSQVSKVHVRETEFEKTPKKSIKRYLYTNA